MTVGDRSRTRGWRPPLRHNPRQSPLRDYPARTSATARIKAGDLVNFVAGQVGGKGGGRPDMAQAGGTDPSGLPHALDGVAEWVRGRA